MAIYDCFQFFDEEHILDLRLNILHEFIDFFVIVESTIDHQGKPKKLNFDSKNIAICDITKQKYFLEKNSIKLMK